MEEHPIQGLMTTAMENLQKMVEVNTIIGDPVKSLDGSLIIPVSKVGFGFAAGGSEFSPNHSDGDSDATLPFGGGSGGGVSITPVAFLIVNEQGIKMVHMDQHIQLYEKMIDFAPQVVDKVQQLMKESAESKKGSDKEEKVKEKEDRRRDGPIQFDI
ncbi:GerW family sporulation protein [Oceanobacillus polygoni]|uniref:Sporulation protein YtfJ n=1 Tax=Oceanobacillus polygoni TaxID=1235259 RepID=A0A9X0YRD6_9BACI|nr:GerW family sporulation protein [Oceanobacillus polygoni]MBP2077328.1 sporulation protein YtfJ [Oceanobacillus polygoni]